MAPLYESKARLNGFYNHCIVAPPFGSIDSPLNVHEQKLASGSKKSHISPECSKGVEKALMFHACTLRSERK